VRRNPCRGTGRGRRRPDANRPAVADSRLAVLDVFEVLEPDECLCSWCDRYLAVGEHCGWRLVHPDALVQICLRCLADDPTGVFVWLRSLPPPA
jgi:hypothetical protein